jgi:hypothetical protein
MTHIAGYDEYLKGLLQEIERIKAKHGTGVFRINSKMSEDTASRLRKYFKDSDSYILELRKCAQCTHSYDVIVTFTGR